MFVRASTLVLAIAASVIAAPGGTTTTSSQCDTGDLQCCTGSMTADNVPEGLSGLLGISLPIDGFLYTGCTPITVIGTGEGADCKQEPICCSNNAQNGLVNVACTPINFDL